jgi:transcriptional regulator with XRE-family HTH domain
MTFPSHSAAVIPGFGFARARDKAFSSIRKLWSLRQSQGWTQLDLASRIGKDPAWVSRKLSGPTNWTLKTFGDLADALDGEVEIQILDLNAARDTANYDAYSGYGEQPIERIGLRRPPSETGSSVYIPAVRIVARQDAA